MVGGRRPLWRGAALAPRCSTHTRSRPARSRWRTRAPTRTGGGYIPVRGHSRIGEGRHDPRGLHRTRHTKPQKSDAGYRRGAPRTNLLPPLPRGKIWTIRRLILVSVVGDRRVYCWKQLAKERSKEWTSIPPASSSGLLHWAWPLHGLHGLPVRLRRLP
jgi:hypothetical protein